MIQFFVTSMQFAWKPFKAHLHKVTNNLQYILVLDLCENNWKSLLQFQRA